MVVPWSKRKAMGWLDTREWDSPSPDDIDRMSEYIGPEDIESVEDLSFALANLGIHPNAQWRWLDQFSEQVMANQMRREREDAIDDAVESKIDEFISKTGREPNDEYGDTVRQFAEREGRAPTDSEMEEIRRLREVRESGRMKSEEEASIIRRVGGEVVGIVGKAVGWLKKKLVERVVEEEDEYADIDTTEE